MGRVVVTCSSEAESIRVSFFYQPLTNPLNSLEYTPRAGGGMADAVDLKSTGATRVGSTPTRPTLFTKYGGNNRIYGCASYYWILTLNSSSNHTLNDVFLGRKIENNNGYNC